MKSTNPSQLDPNFLSFVKFWVASSCLGLWSICSNKKSSSFYFLLEVLIEMRTIFKVAYFFQDQLQLLPIQSCAKEYIKLICMV